MAAHSATHRTLRRTLWGTTVLDRAIGGITLRYLLVVGLALVAVYSLLDGVRELRYLNEGYGALDVVWYLLLTTPRRLYQVFPFVALVGSVMAVGGLAATGELVAWRALGVKRSRLLVPVLGMVTIVLVVVVLCAETWATNLELKARSFRLDGITGQVSLSGPGGLWLRDGANFIYIQYPFLDQSLATDFHHIKIYRLSEDAQLEGWLTAVHGQHRDHTWQLETVHRYDLDDAGVRHRYQSELQWPSRLNSAALGSSVLRPSLLSISELKALLAYFDDNALDDAHYHAALWRRYFYPGIVWAAVLLGLPFVINLRGRESRTRALAVAVAVGLAWYVAEQLFQSIVLALAWSPLWGGLVPILLALMGAVLLLRRR